MSEQHGLLHVVLDELVPSWTRLESEPSVIASIATMLTGESRRLEVVLEVHLALEETTIFPWLEALPRSERDEMRAEIRETHRVGDDADGYDSRVTEAVG